MPAAMLEAASSWWMLAAAVAGEEDVMAGADAHPAFILIDCSD